MRFSSTTLLLSSVGVFSTTALAAPIRVVVVEKVSTEGLDDFFRSLRLGHAAAGAAGANAMSRPSLDSAHSTDELHALPFPLDLSFKPAPRPALDAASSGISMTPDQEFDTFAPIQSVQWTGECRDRSSMRVKLERIEDQIRQWLGMALVSRSPLCADERPFLSKLQVDPKKIVPPPTVPDMHTPCYLAGFPPTPYGSNIVAPRPPMRGGYWMQRMRPKSFGGRLQRALNSLTPFESGVIAFVVGCGLGVLVRMFFVFIILGVRMWKCSQKRRDGQVRLGEDGEEDEEGKDGDEIVGVVLFDAGSIKAASVDDLPLYQEKV